MYKQAVVLGVLLTAVSVLLTRQETLRGRLAELETMRHASPAEVQALQAELEALRVRSQEAIAQLRAATAAGANRLEIESRLCTLEAELRRTESELVAEQKHNARLVDDLPRAIEAHVAPLAGDLSNSRLQLDDWMRTHADNARATQAQLARLEQAIPRETGTDELWNDLLGPTVQVSGEESVGSGVLLRSRANADGSWTTHVLTAWHVIRDLSADPDTGETIVPVTLYARDGSIQPHTARLVKKEADLDVALLALETTTALPHGARLASRETLRHAQVFEPVWAVGCPLGNDPIPTAGTLSDTHHHVDGLRYWMISAPTYIGNSGGGVYNGRTRELVGIFTKIYTHGSVRPTVVPHMGLATPLETVYDWLEHEGIADIEPVGPRVETAAATK
jgi:S1-C subfamily serine protease